MREGQVLDARLVLAFMRLGREGAHGVLAWQGKKSTWCTNLLGEGKYTRY
jgi:hypothetical protein